MSARVTTDANASVGGSARARRRWLMLAHAVWVICAALALLILLAGIPLGYALLFSGAGFSAPIDAPAWYINSMSVVQGIVSLAAALVSLALAVIVFWKKRAERGALLVSFYLLAYGIILGGPLEALDGFPQLFPGVHALRGLLIPANVILALQSALLIPTLLLFYLFPNGRFVPRWMRYAALSALFLAPLFVYASTFEWIPTATPFAQFTFAIFLSLLGAGVYAQIYRYRRVANAVERQQTKWVLFGLALTFFVMLLVQVPYVLVSQIPANQVQPWWLPLMSLSWWVCVSILPFSFAIAVLGFRLWDIDIIINRALVYGALTAFVGGVYILSVGAFGALFQTGQSLAAFALATVVVALLARPLHARLQRSVNRLIPTAPTRAQMIAPERATDSRAQATSRLRLLVYGAWTVVMALALLVFVAALPGYARLVAASDLQPVDAPLPFALSMYLLTVAASIFIVALCLALAALLFWRKRAETMALVTSFFLLAYGIAWGGALENALGAPQSESGRMLANSIGSAISFTLMLLLLFLFPSGKFVPRWTRWALVASLVITPLLVFALSDVFYSSPFAPLLNGALLLFVLVGLYAQLYRYRRVSNALERQQTKAFVYGLFLAIALGVLASFAYPTILNTPPGTALLWWMPLAQLAWIAAVAVIPIALTLAVMRYRLWDIDILANRALVYGALTALIIGIFVLVVALFGALFQTSGNLVISLVATAFIAVLFQPLRERLQRGVNRLMYGERDDPYRVLTRLGAQLENAIEPAYALTQTVETIAAALKLPYVAIALEQDGNLQTVAAHGAAPKTASRFPLIHAGEPIGELIAAPRAPGETLSAADERLLRDLARQISIVARTAALTSDLEQARLRLVTERGEARRQLGSDLHDGVGHQLVALTRQIENATPKPPDASAQISSEFLANLKQQLVAITTQVRNLSHQLYLPELEVLGLSDALRERAHGYPNLRILVDAPETLPPLPAEIETAAYYIALEAITNVDKHANAKTCHIRLRVASTDSISHKRILELDIVDDGRGIAPTAAHGLGLLSMRARAAEVGGTCHILQNRGGGTAVRAQIPFILQVE